MIHLLAAHELEPGAPASYWVGSNAPDYVETWQNRDEIRAAKDSIHLRDAPDRWAALKEVYAGIDRDNPFERGWFIHLFTDACWDETEVGEFHDSYKPASEDDHWFPAYRNEVGEASFYLYRHLTWAGEVWGLVKSARINEIATSLPVDLAGVEAYWRYVIKTHEESGPARAPAFYTGDKIKDFALRTASRYNEWTARQ